MDTSNGKEQPKNQEDVARRKPVKEEDAECRKWKLKHIQCSGPDWQIYIPLRLGPLVRVVY
jgi:hypothetical protein